MHSLKVQQLHRDVQFAPTIALGKPQLPECSPSADCVDYQRS
jgi:hypothetical protein